MGNVLFAGRALVQDFLPTLLFALLVALKVDVTVATGAAIAMGVGQLILMWMMKRAIAPLQWASLALVLVFGAAGMLTHDPRFLMAKPTLIYAIVGVVMLKRGWMLRYLPPAAEGRGAGAMIVFGYVWAGLSFATGAANLGLAIWAPAIWPAFMAVVPMASKLTLFAIQYVTVRQFAIREQAAAEKAGAEKPTGAAQAA